jgi:acylglycerol lipase
LPEESRSLPRRRPWTKLPVAWLCKLRGNAPCLAWIDPDVEPKAVLLCVHGLGLHNGTYEDFGKRMSKLGLATYAIDMRGFGSWMQAKGREMVDFEGCMLDLHNTLKAIRKANPGLPIFLLGESMGGAIALRGAAMYPDMISGLISSVPAGDRFEQKKTALRVAYHLLSAPNKPIDVGTSVIEQATKDPQLRQVWGNDPLARLKLTPNELLQFQRFMNQNHESAKKIKCTPVLIVQGCKDRLVRPEGTVELYNELGTKDRELVLIENSEHLIFEENQFNDQVIDLVKDWINARLPATANLSAVTKK